MNKAGQNMTNISTLTPPEITGWTPISDAFKEWLGNRETILEPGLAPEPTIKLLIFLALLDANKACSYDDIREIIKSKNVINGIVPDNTLRTSVLNLGKTLEKAQHSLELKSFRGRFQLIPRTTTQSTPASLPKEHRDQAVLLLDPPAIKAEEIAYDLIEKAMLP